MYGQSGVVGFHNSVGYFGWGDHWVGVHNPVGVFFSDLRDQQGTHTGTGTASKRMSQLESLQTIAGFGLFPDHVQHGVDEFSSFCVMALGPVVTSSGLSKDKVVWSEDLSEGAWPDGVHGTGLQVHEDGTGHVFAAWGFIVVYVDSLELEVWVTVVSAGGVNAVLVGDDFPELKKIKHLYSQYFS